MGLTKEEWRQSRIEDAHHALQGHRRAPWWPDVPKHEADLGTCRTPREHEWQEPMAVPLKGRTYQLEVTVCKQCPLHLTDVVLVKKAGGKA